MSHDVPKLPIEVEEELDLDELKQVDNEVLAEETGQALVQTDKGPPPNPEWGAYYATAYIPDGDG